MKTLYKRMSVQPGCNPSYQTISKSFNFEAEIEKKNKLCILLIVASCAGGRHNMPQPPAS